MVNTRAGVATFNSVIVAAGSYGFSAADGLLPGVSWSTTVNPATARKLIFSPIPASGSLNVALPSPINVSVEDVYGNVVINDASSVTLSIAYGPVGGGISSGSGVTVNVVNGVAKFSGVSFVKSGTYKLKAVDGSLALAISGSIVIQ